MDEEERGGEIGILESQSVGLGRDGGELNRDGQEGECWEGRKLPGME